MSQSKDISKKTNELDLSHVNFDMSCELGIPFEIFTAFVTLESFHPRVRPRVALQITRRNASEVALVTLEWLLPCVVPHHVNFQITSCNAGKLASCASVRLFPRVGPLVLLQSAWINCSIIALVAFVWFLSSVFHNVLS